MAALTQTDPHFANMAAQQALLAEVSGLVEAGRVRSSRGEHLGRITAAHLRQAHALQESGRTRGKIVLEGF
ncbi:zinc-binding dehydrogenase [Ideonella livida]|uniref:zinc-binding dehydrogenase n=1 Tax=Ideonella livida TaxID=2707176 RepID=UPI0035BFEE2C